MSTTFHIQPASRCAQFEAIGLSTKPAKSLTGNVENEPAAEKSFICHLCGTSFMRKESLLDHLKGPQHDNVKPYACADCKKAYTRRSDLKRHEREVHRGTKFVCNVLALGERRGCGKRFSRALTLKSHQDHCRALQSALANAHAPNWSRMAWPTNVELLLRDETARILAEAKSLGAKELECRICHAQRLPNHVGSFVRHLIDHLESILFGAYQCELCGLSFGWDLHLQKHQEVCAGYRGPAAGCQISVNGFERSCAVHGADATLLEDVLAGRRGSSCVLICEQTFQQLKVQITSQLEQSLGQIIKYEPRKPLEYLEAVRERLRQLDPLYSLAPHESLLDGYDTNNQASTKANPDMCRDDFDTIFALRKDIDVI
ncbi:uncharacterized protein PV09_06708 [Verruconis gallopava]|uniref:pH-response transcription factor pacC/RIM101 n=1 Tax=Verruconis gallopava TaxID=253628 RepID=A0A0D2ARN9_9PEZI|nr:uncharacterized protein PV09_06708 [Verruconis gallopava]KIW01859.1 hypothetical protein PV09_06708 [Verruconis gallopava]